MEVVTIIIHLQDVDLLLLQNTQTLSNKQLLHLYNLL